MKKPTKQPASHAGAGKGKQSLRQTKRGLAKLRGTVRGPKSLSSAPAARLTNGERSTDGDTYSLSKWQVFNLRIYQANYDDVITLRQRLRFLVPSLMLASDRITW